MGTSLSPARLRAARGRAQRLDGTATTVAAVAGHLGGLQAQAAPPARMAVRARAAGLTAAAVDQACADRAVTRTWAMRGTLHMIATADVRWMTGIFGPIFIRKYRRRRLQLGLDDALVGRALDALAAILAGSPPLTRAELITALAAEGIVIDPKTQQPPHLLGYAAGQGLICRGPDRPGEEPTYVRLDEWAPDAPALSPDEALAKLARRYLGGYGPATRADFATWSGLPAADTGRAWALIADETVPVTAEGPGMTGTQLAALAGATLDGPMPGTRLLGHFDPLLMGYRDRSLILDPADARRIQTGGGFVQPTVLAGGRVVGTWRLDRGAQAVVVESFTPLATATRDELASEAAALKLFFDIDVTLQLTEPS